jgi:hypothetical protein
MIKSINKEIKLMQKVRLLDVMKAKKWFALIAKFITNVDLFKLSMIGRDYFNLVEHRYDKEIHMFN